MHKIFQTTTKWSCCSNADFKELYDSGLADCLLACTDAPPTTNTPPTTTATPTGKYYVLPSLLIYPGVLLIKTPTKVTQP